MDISLSLWIIQYVYNCTYMMHIDRDASKKGNRVHETIPFLGTGGSQKNFSGTHRFGTFHHPTKQSCTAYIIDWGAYRWRKSAFGLFNYLSLSVVHMQIPNGKCLPLFVKATFKNVLLLLKLRVKHKMQILSFWNFSLHNFDPYCSSQILTHEHFDFLPTTHLKKFHCTSVLS